MRKNYPCEFQRLGLAVLTASQERVMRQRHPWRGLVGSRVGELTRTLRACLRELTQPSTFSFPKSQFQKPFFVLVKVSTALSMSPQSSQSNLCWFCFLLARTCGLRRLPAAKVSGQVAKLDLVETAEATNKHISTCVKPLFRACLQSSPSNHEEELTQVLTRHVSQKSSYAGLRRAGFCLRGALL